MFAGRSRSSTIVSDRSSTIVNDRQRSSTIVNDRQRSSKILTRSSTIVNITDDRPRLCGSSTIAHDCQHYVYDRQYYAR